MSKQSNNDSSIRTPNCGYLGVVTTFEVLYQIGLTGKLYSDPGLETIISMAQATAAQSPVCVRMILHDEKLLAQLKRMAYPGGLVVQDDSVAPIRSVVAEWFVEWRWHPWTQWWRLWSVFGGTNDLISL